MMKKLLLIVTMLVPLAAVGARYNSVVPTKGEVLRLQRMVDLYGSNRQSLESFRVYVAGGCLASQLTFEQSVRVMVLMESGQWDSAIFMIKDKIPKCLPELDLVDPKFAELTISMGTMMAYMRGVAANRYFHGTLERDIRRKMGIEK